MSENLLGDNITKLPVGFKVPPSEDSPSLKIIDRFDKGCDHKSVYVDGRFVEITYQIREGEMEVECGNCKQRLEPMWVLKNLANRESGYHRKRKIAQEEMNRLSKRSKTKCHSCGAMTPISKAKSQ